jgi:hypothetical protein
MGSFTRVEHQALRSIEKHRLIFNRTIQNSDGVYLVSVAERAPLARSKKWKRLPSMFWTGRGPERKLFIDTATRFGVRRYR